MGQTRTRHSKGHLLAMASVPAVRPEGMVPLDRRNELSKRSRPGAGCYRVTKHSAHDIAIAIEDSLDDWIPKGY